MLWMDLEVGDVVKFTDEFIKKFQRSLFREHPIKNILNKELIIVEVRNPYYSDWMILEFNDHYAVGFNSQTGYSWFEVPTFQIVKLKD